MISKSLGLCLRCNTKGYAATVIISVYKDISKLVCVLYGLSKQTFKNFEVIVSEDGNSAEMREFLAPFLALNSGLRHLTQEDLGFRKNKALNTAIRASVGRRLIFIDGDCVPHPRFVEAHVALEDENRIGAGRRVELGQYASDFVLQRPSLLEALFNPFSYSILSPILVARGGKNPESGVNSSLLQYLVKNKPLPLVGCNFSCPKTALEKVNGFNERYEAPGIGEDTDIEWRLREAGFTITNLKFMATLFHLHHPRSYQLSHANMEIFRSTQKESTIAPNNGRSPK